MGKKFEMPVEEFKTIYKELKSVQGIADKYGYGFDAVRGYMKRNNIEFKYKTIYSCDENFFSKDDEESFYWAGFLAADGSICKKGKDHAFVLKLALATKDLIHLEKFKKALNSDSPIKNYVVTNEQNVTYYSSVFVIYSKKLCDDLARFNVIPNKTFILTFPEWIKTHKLVHHYIRGYIDGDGCFSKYCAKNRNVTQTTFNVVGTIDFLTNIHHIIDNKCNFIPYVRKIIKHKKEKVARLAYSGNRIISTITDFVYKDATIFLERKYKSAMLSKTYMVNKIPPSKDELINTYKELGNQKAVAQKFGYSIGHIHCLMKRYDLTKSYNKRITFS